MKFEPLRTSFSAGRLSTATTAGGRLFFVRHDGLAAVRIDGRRAEPWLPKARLAAAGPLTDDRVVHVAASDRGAIFHLDGDGSVFRRAPGGGAKLVRMTPPDPRVASHYAHRVGFAWDADGARLVVVGGQDRNDTHVLEKGARAFRSLRGAGPTHGTGRAVASSRGVYYVIENDVWLLAHDAWRLVGRLPASTPTYVRSLVFADDERARLLVVTQLGHDDPLCVHAFDASGAREIATDIRPTKARLLDDHDATMGFDPASRCLVVADADGVCAAAIDDEGGKRARWPDRALPRRARVADPPHHWYREAVAIDAHADARPVVIPPALVGKGQIVLAVLPETPFVPFRKAKSLLLLSHDPPYEAEYHTLAFENAFEVRFVEDELPPCLPMYGTKDRKMALRPAFLGRRFLEIDPAYAKRVDTLRDGEPCLASRSKIGGFPAFGQGGDEEATDGSVADLRCENCSARLRFAAQIRGPHFHAMSGNLFVYVCPFGCYGAAHVET